MPLNCMHEEEVRAAGNTASDPESGEKEGRGEKKIGYTAYWTKAKEPSSEWTVCHTLHLVLLGCLLPTVICGVANFYVAVGIFKGTAAPTMWAFPIPMAGNTFAVIFIQTFANFVVSGAIQLFDVLNGLVPPLQPGVISWWPKPTSLWFWWMQPTEIIISPRDEPDKHLLERVVDSIIRAGMWIMVAEAVFLGPMLGIMYAMYGNDGYNDYPIPQWVSSVQGAVLAFTFSPIWQLSCYITLGQRAHDETRAFLLSNDACAPLEEERPRSRLTMYRRFSAGPIDPIDGDSSHSEGSQVSELVRMSGIAEGEEEEDGRDTEAVSISISQEDDVVIEEESSVRSAQGGDRR